MLDRSEDFCPKFTQLRQQRFNIHNLTMIAPARNVQPQT